MSKDAKENKVDDFEDIFEDDFLETEQSVNEERNAEDGVASDEGTSGVKTKSSFLSGLDKKQIITFGVGGVILGGIIYLLYGQFVPKTVKVNKDVGRTEYIKGHKAPTYKREEAKPKPKEVVKPVVNKVEDGFLINKKSLQDMIGKFTNETDSINKNQHKLNERINSIQDSFYKVTQETQENTQKEFLQMNQQLNVLAKQQSDIALKQQKLKVEEASFVKAAVSNNTSRITSNSDVIKENNQILSDQSQKINELVNYMSSVSKEVIEMNKSMEDLKQSMVKTQVELKLVIAQKAAEMEKMTLRAVVPGRAWLVNGKGSTTTIAVGTELPYYGKVLKIDSKSNTVTMSTGYMFS